MRIAIIDLGTNTFNLLIAEVNSDRTYNHIYKTKLSVKLGEGGIDKGFIAPYPFQRGIDALKKYKETIARFNVNKVFAFATSAIRTAANGIEFTEKAKQETGIDIEIISGEREAELIYFGVQKGTVLSDKLSLIIDIGGGSTEFIIADNNKIFWKHSFLLGASRLLEKFKPFDPFTDKEHQQILNYLNIELQPLFNAVKLHPVSELIGSSGSFDSLAEMISYRFYSPEILKGKTEYTFSMEDWESIYDSVIKSNKEERMKMKGLIEMRVDMIVIACIIIKFIVSSINISKMRLSTYALKEGVLDEIIKNKIN